jgi:hypothetical protein
LQAIESELESLGAGSEVLQTPLDTVVNGLGHTEQQLRGGELVRHLHRMNIQHDAQHASAQRIVLQELHNARGHHLVMLLLSLLSGELPKREDFITAAAPYLV